MDDFQYRILPYIRVFDIANKYSVLIYFCCCPDFRAGTCGTFFFFFPFFFCIILTRGKHTALTHCRALVIICKVQLSLSMMCVCVCIYTLWHTHTWSVHSALQQSHTIIPSAAPQCITSVSLVGLYKTPSATH